jgi:alkylation response protein AidB-like acyl-CoA dehydrogenase
MNDTNDLSAFRAAVRQWLTETGPPELPENYNERFAALREWQLRLYHAGWIGLHWPREVGGRGLTIRHSLIVSEELVRARLPQPVGAIGLEVVGPTILHYGDHRQRTELLPRLLSGADLWCQGFSEPEAGSDLASLRTRAALHGDELVLNGQKVWTSWATDADWCAVLARTDPEAPRHRGISYLLVDMRSQGVTVRPITQITGDAEFNELFFQDVRVPLRNVVAGLGDGWRLAMHTLGHERAGYAMRRRLENQTAFADLVAALRTAGGPAALDDDGLGLLGNLLVDLKVFEAMSRDTEERLATGRTPSPLDSMDKLTLTATEQKLYATAAELLGGERMLVGARPRGLVAEKWLRGLLYARSASVYGGSSQIQRTIVAQRHLDLPRGR